MLLRFVCGRFQAACLDQKSSFPSVLDEIGCQLRVLKVDTSVPMKISDSMSRNKLTSTSNVGVTLVARVTSLFGGSRASLDHLDFASPRVFADQFVDFLQIMIVKMMVFLSHHLHLVSFVLFAGGSANCP
mgnify:CR=1 FL=1